MLITRTVTCSKMCSIEVEVIKLQSLLAARPHKKTVHMLQHLIIKRLFSNPLLKIYKVENVLKYFPSQSFKSSPLWPLCFRHTEEHSWAGGGLINITLIIIIIIVYVFVFTKLIYFKWITFLRLMDSTFVHS